MIHPHTSNTNKVFLYPKVKIKYLQVNSKNDSKTWFRFN